MKLFAPLFLFFAFITSCSEKGINPELYHSTMSETTTEGFFLAKDSVDFHAFQTRLPVIAFESIKELSECQKKSILWFENHQDEILPKVKQKIFEYYQAAYPNYKKSWLENKDMTEKEVLRYLPFPTFPDSLLGYIKPVAFVVHSSNNCSENSFSLDFDCSWDKKMGLGIYVEDGEVKFASVGPKTFPN